MHKQWFGDQQDCGLENVRQENEGNYEYRSSLMKGTS